MRVLVTGGGGFIGTPLIARLQKERHDVVVLDHRAAPAHFKGTWVVGSVCDSGALEQSFAQPIDVVFHLAADSSVRSAPESLYKNNVEGTFLLAKTCAERKVKHVVFSSSQTVYGAAKGVVDESSPTKPVSMYAASKVAGEALLSSFANSAPFSLSIVRFANVVGPGASQGVTFDFVRKLRANPKALEIIGDGKQEKSFIFVEDVIDALIVLIEKNKGIDTFNVCSRDTLVVDDLAHIVIAEMKLEGVVITHTGSSWQGDVAKLSIQGKKLEALGWTPLLSSAEAIRAAVRAMLQSSA